MKEPGKALAIADVMATRADQNLIYTKGGQGQFRSPDADLYSANDHRSLQGASQSVVATSMKPFSESIWQPLADKYWAYQLLF